MKKINLLIRSVNNFNLLTNFVGNIDDLSKLTKCVEYKGLKTIGFGNKIEKRYEKHINRLDNNTYKYGVEFGQERKRIKIDIN